MTKQLLTLRRATESEHQETRRLNYEEWGAPQLSLPVYLKREEMLAKQPFAKDLRCYCLFKDAEILSSCEVYKRRGLFKSPGKQLEMKDVYSIASVFTPVIHRGQGYASKMMTLLKDELTKLNAFASTLYSDIGETFYSRFGWAIHPSVMAKIDLTETTPVADSQIELLRESQIKELLEENILVVKDEMEYRASKQPVFCVEPNIESQSWLIARSKFYAEHFKSALNIDYWGIRKGNEFMLWMYDFREAELVVTMHRVSSPETFQQFISAISYEARKNEVQRICIWDPCVAAREFKTAKITNRKDSLSSLLLFDNNSDILWLHNEKYAWV